MKELFARRAELKRTLKRLRVEIAETRKALAQVKAEIAAASPRPRALGGLRASIRQALREHPMTTAELTRIVMAERGLDVTDKPRFRAVQHRLRASLEMLRQRGLVATTAATAPQASVWTLTRR